jgi:flagella basal body P-ring formation protein FlgA
MTRLLTLAALIGLVASPGAHASGRLEAIAEASLRTALQRGYPSVSQWELQPMLGRRQSERLEELEPVDAQAASIGARSSVRVSTTNPQRRFVTLWFSVSGFQPVLTARSRIEPGSTVDAVAVSIDERDVLALGCKPMTSTDELMNMRARRGFAENAVLCLDGFEPRPAVSRGELVLVRSVAGPITVTAKGIALQDGSLGAILKIKNPDNRRTYFAAVTGAQEVTVHD